VSAFERFQANVPFVALTTLQMREAVENERGSLDAFVMEYQTFVNADLENDFEFIPFGIRHDNPLYAVGNVSAAEREVLELFDAFAENERSKDTARDYGFDPPQYTAPFPVPSGERLIRAQQLWKEKKDAGRPVAAVFVADVSGSMAGSRIAALKRALTSGAGFITEENSVGMVVFNDDVTVVLPIDEFDLNQQGAFNYAVRTMDAFGGTAMYDGVLVGLRLLLDEVAVNPNVKPLLFVLTDGETTDGFTFGDTNRVIEGLGIPVYTVGFEANIDELSRLSSLVEAANLNAGEGDVEFRIGSLFNAEL
jgi:Ca-activated chloride channel family protein